MGIGRFAFTPILPMMQGDSGLTVQQGAWIASANYLGYLVGALWTMVQRAPPAPAIRISLVVASLSTLAMAYADGLAPWLVLRFVAGVASAWALVNVSTWCFEQLTQLRRPALNGVVFAGVGTGVAIAGLLCLILLLRGAGSRDAWLACGGLSLGITAVVWPVLGRGGRAAAVAAPARYRWSGDAIRLVACYGTYGFGYIVPATFIPAMARQLIPDPVVFGWAWPLFGAAAVASTLLAGWLIRFLSNRRIWMISALVMAAGVVAPLVQPGLAGILVSALLVGSTFVVITQVGVQEARALAGASAGVLLGAMTSAFAAGQVLGPLAVSAVGGNFTYALLLSGALLVASAAALTGSSPR